MTPEFYQQSCLRTVPEDMKFWTMDDASASMLARKQLMANCALGLAGEGVEIADTPTADEIGDGCWYAYVFMWCLEDVGYEPSPFEAPDSAKLHRFAGEICEIVKKITFHNKDILKYQGILIPTVHNYVNTALGLNEKPPSGVMQQNIDKLLARWPGKFGQ